MDREDVIKGLEESIAFFRDRVTGDMYDKWLHASVDALALLKAQEPTQWHKEGCANNSSVCIVDIGNDMPALLAAVVANGRFIFDGLDITEKVRHWFAIPGIKADGQAVKWE